MTASMLHEYVTLVLEKIRTKKGQKGIMGDRFDMTKFKSLDNYHAMYVYAEKYLEMLGQGSSRAAFLMSNRHVLKIAINDKGVGQNNAEIEVYTNPASKPVVAKVYQADPESKWIISEVVKPLTSVKEFEELTGIDWETFCEYVNDGVKNGSNDNGSPKFIRAVIQTALENHLLRGDIAQQDFSLPPEKDSLNHYGKTPDGRVVLLDYGFTNEVWKTHYKPEKDQAEREHDALMGRPNKEEKAADTDHDDHELTVHDEPKAPSRSKVRRTQGHPNDPNKTAPAGPFKRAAGADDKFEKTKR